VLFMLVAGFICARFGVFSRDASDAFHRFVIYVCLPALIWKLLPTIRFEPGLWVVICAPWILLAISAAITYGLCAAFAWRRDVCGALLLCVPLGNTSFLGFPMITALLGESALRYALLYDQLGSFLALSSYGLLVSARFSGGPLPSLRETLLRVVRFPPFIALLLAFTPVVRFAILQPLWSRLSDALVPLAMFAVGLRIELKLPRPWGAFLAGLALKLLLMPALAWLVARAFGATLVLTHVVVLEAAMPAMITAGAIAILTGLAPELSAALVGYGVLVGMLSVPLIAYLLGASAH
jgi:predicted permease